MKNLITPGILTGQGLLSFVFLAFGVFLLLKSKVSKNPHAKINIRILIGSIINIIIGFIFFVIYLNQIAGKI